MICVIYSVSYSPDCGNGKNDSATTGNLNPLIQPRIYHFTKLSLFYFELCFLILCRTYIPQLHLLLISTGTWTAGPVQPAEGILTPGPRGWVLPGTELCSWSVAAACEWLVSWPADHTGQVFQEYKIFLTNVNHYIADVWRISLLLTPPSDVPARLATPVPSWHGSTARAVVPTVTPPAWPTPRTVSPLWQAWSGPHPICSPLDSHSVRFTVPSWLCYQGFW
jgi:hypothetical protein